MLIAYTLVAGFALDGLITKAFHQPDSLLFVNRLLLYYFVFEFVMRYFMQNVPALDVQPYLHLPIKRNSIAHFLLSKSLLHVFNSIVLLLFMPFAFTVVAGRWGIAGAVSWLTSLVILSWAMHYLVIYYKKKLDDSIWGIVVLIGGFGLLGAADYLHWFKLSDLSAIIFNQPSFLPVVAILLVVALYRLIFSLLVGGMYAEDWSAQKDAATEWGKTGDLHFLRGFGNYGEWIGLELKLILRNKRPRSFIFISAFMLLYGVVAYRNDAGNEISDFSLFVGMFITGAFMINYGQFLFSWQGAHFDFTLTRPISIRQFIESKYLLLCGITVITFVLSIPYAYFGWHIVSYHLAIVLFNMGINVFIMMNMAMWGPQKIDLKKGSTFNHEGTGAAQWIMGFPILLSPYLFFLPFKYFFSTYVGIAAVGIAGLLGIIFRSYLIGITTKRFTEKRYEIAAGFRKE
ncbi:MAG: hypothetical protein HOP37_05455 [Cyclobacteriaceae bacterium]|nr:hypothetical protein [Cyclobacteriaceae bacterium]